MVRGSGESRHSFSNGAVGACTLDNDTIRTLSLSQEDVEGISLLGQIFPDFSTSELLQVHKNRLRKAVLERSKQPSSTTAGSQIGEQDDRGKEQFLSTGPLHLREQLPDDFLRLPNDFAVRRYNIDTEKWEYHVVADLEKAVMKQHQLFRQSPSNVPLDDGLFSRVVFRDSTIGLGMTLCEEGSYVRVHSVTSKNGKRWYSAPSQEADGPDGPAVDADICPGDVVLGINGHGFVPHQPLGSMHESLLRHAVSMIQQSPDPVVIHLHRHSHLKNANGLHSPSSLMWTREHQEKPAAIQSSDKMMGADSSVATLHPFVVALSNRGLVHAFADKIAITKKIAQFAFRAYQLEASSSVPIDPITQEMKTPTNGDSAYTNEYGEQCSKITSTFSSKQFRGSQLGRHAHIHPSPQAPQHSCIAPLLPSVRKGLCARILNTFLEGSRTAYTIWVYDVESGREWYAPVRYFSDFHELRDATLPLSPSVAEISFPTTRWAVFGSRESSESSRTMCDQLENFLRKLCSVVYREKLHPNVVEIAIHVQSFLGCDIALGDFGDDGMYSHTEFVVMRDIAGDQTSRGAHNNAQIGSRLFLKRTIQQYTYRLFLLDTMELIVNRFVGESRARGLGAREIQTLEAKGRVALKERSMHELERIRTFLDQMQELILEGCMVDLSAICRRESFSPLRQYMNVGKDEMDLDELVRESVREQLEIEVYVPLRSVVSNLLVNGWRHDDLEMKFKMQELRKRPQALFRIPPDKQHPSGWKSASSILKEGVGRSTLPCAKLHAIVDAAKEIAHVHVDNMGGSDSAQHQVPCNEMTARVPCNPTLGADDFLPIFIYCVVQAEMERPCALCVLLRTLCERSSRTGETGYYLASFEAAVAYIQEIDLSEDR